MSRLMESIAEHARRIPLQPALSDAVTTVCYGELPSILEQLGMQLDRHCPRSRPVAIHLPNSAAWALLDLALLHRRHPVVPVPTFFTDAQVAHVLEQSGASCLLTASKPQRQPACALSVLDRALYCVPQRHDKAGPALAPDTAKVTYTSGSTGEPKGVCLSLQGLETVAESIVERIGAERAGRVMLCRASFANLPIRTASVNAVLAVNVAYFWTDAGRIVQEIRRVLRPGGRLVVYVTDRASMRNWSFASSDTHVHWDAETLHATLRGAGFGAAEIEVRSLRLRGRVKGLLAVARMS